MSKSQLVLKLTEIAKALGITPTPLAWAHLSVEELKQRIAEAQAQLARKQDASDDVARRNDSDWFDMGGTRN
jgi:uncharacterized small protein (DUF1192 family)